MKKMISSLLILMLIFTGCGLGEPDAHDSENIELESNQYLTEDNWVITYYEAEIRDYLHSEDTTTKEEVYNEASEGNQYLLISLEISSLEDVSGSFKIDELILVDEMGNEYSRIDDDFILDHGYRQIPPMSFNYGNHSGWVVYEIPEGTSFSYYTLTYKDVEIKLEEVE